MSTIDVVNAKTLKDGLSEFQSVAITIFSGKNILSAGMNELYEMAKEQPTVLETNAAISGQEHFEMKDKKVLVSYSGEDVSDSIRARRLVPSKANADECCGAKKERGEYLNIIREVSYELMHRSLIRTGVYFSKNPDFMGKIDFIVPREFAKLALDLNMNFIPSTLNNAKIYTKSKELNEPEIKIVCYPDWVNEEWLYWKSRNNVNTSAEDAEPPRIIMLFDADSNTAFLLGARCYGEVNKAVLTLIWNLAIKKNIGLPLYGNSKIVSIMKGGKKAGTGFITLGLPGTGKTAIGMSQHKGHLNIDKGDSIEIGNDSGLIFLLDPSSKKRGVIGLESNFYTNCDAQIKDAVMTAENIMIYENEKSEKVPFISAGRENGMMIANRTAIKGAAEENDQPWPDYITLIIRDETLPPVMLIKDLDTFIAMYLSFGVKSCCAEVDSEDLCFVPGANPYSIWGEAKELEMLSKITKKAKFKGLIINTGGFFKDTDNNLKGIYTDIPEELTDSIYPKIAKNEIKWKEWKNVPGLFFPDKGSFKAVSKDFDNIYDPYKIKDKKEYNRILRERFESKAKYLKKIGGSSKYHAIIQKIIAKIEK